jgi:cysteine desulfurase
MRAGTENVAGIAGFGVAALEAYSGLDHMDSLSTLRNQMISGIRRYTSVRVFGEAASRLPNTACIAMPGVSAEIQLIAFDLLGVSISSGSACSSGKVESSHVLAAMGVGADEALTAIRVSLGWSNTPKDVDDFINAWATIFSKSQAQPVQAMVG